MSDRNVYAPPSAAVADPVRGGGADEGEFNPQGRSCPAGAGWQWYGASWRIFKAAPLTWWGALLVTFVAMIVLSMIPLVNLLVMVAFPIIMAGIGACASSVMSTGNFEFTQVFDGFKRRPGALLLSGLLYMVLVIVCMGVIFVAFGAGGLFKMFTGGMHGKQEAAAAMAGLGGMFFLAYMVVLSVAVSAIAFAPYLIHERGMPVVEAMLTSTKACFKNIPASLVWIVCYFGLAIAATIPIGLGWLILLPVVMLTGYVAYRDIFYSA